MNALLTALTQIAASEIAAVMIVKTVISDRNELSVTITERAGPGGSTAHSAHSETLKLTETD